MFFSNFIIRKIYCKIIGKHGITKIDHFFTKLVIGFNGMEIGIPWVKLLVGVKLIQGLLNPIPDGDLIIDQRI